MFTLKQARRAPVATALRVVLPTVALIGVSGCQTLKRTANDVLEHDLFYWLILTAVGLLLYRLLGLKALRKRWAIPVLYSLATAWRAFGGHQVKGKEWIELVVLAGSWLGAAIVGSFLQAFVSAIVGKRPEQSDDVEEPAVQDAVEESEPEPVTEPAKPKRPAPKKTPHAKKTPRAKPKPPPPKKPRRAKLKPSPPKKPPSAKPARSQPKVPSDATLQKRLKDWCSEDRKIDVPPARSHAKHEPWGTLDDAVALLGAKQIKPARELLRRLCKADPRDFDCLVLAAFDLARPPEDRKNSLKYVQQADSVHADSSEYSSLFVLGTIGSRDYETLWGYYRRVGESPIRSRFGNFLAMLSNLCASDLLFQRTFRHVGTDEMTTMFANSSLVGVAQLLIRQHVRAFKTFTKGKERAKLFPEAFESNFEIALSDKQHTELAALMRAYCRIGQGLTLYDAGLIGPGRAVIGGVAKQGRLSPGLQASVDGFLAETECWSDTDLPT